MLMARGDAVDFPVVADIPSIDIIEYRWIKQGVVQRGVKDYTMTFRTTFDGYNIERLIPARMCEFTDFRKTPTMNARFEVFFRPLYADV